MKLCKLVGEFAVCKLNSIENVDFSGKFVFLSKTPDELSVVCEATGVPSGAIFVERGWSILKIDGTLDFGLVGVIAGISGILAAAGISVFVVSTYDTDYILLKEDKFAEAAELLEKGGHTFG